MDKKDIRILPLMGPEFADALARGHLRPVTDLKELFALFRGDPANADVDDLTLASRIGDRDRVENLLRTGANVNGSLKAITTPLLESIGAEHIEIAKILLDHGADLTIAIESGWTPLHSASWSGFESIVLEIVTRQVDVNLKTREGLTALMLAAQGHRAAIVKTLLNNGADVAITDNEGMTALLHAAVGYEESGSDFRCVEAIVAKGAAVNTQANNGWTALMGVSFYDDVRSVELLLARGADPNIRDKQGRTATDLAEFRKNAIFKLLRSSPTHE